jgi:hypothetical protein
MFATIVIVLPSKFTGGSLHLSHSGQSKVVDIQTLSSSTTSVLAWYTDVYHSVHPVLSGYRLALSYNLIHPPNSQVPKPILPQLDAVYDEIRQVLLSWRQNSEEHVTKLAYVFDHEYSQSNLKAEALKGSDARTLALLQPIAETLGFQIYLANLEYEMSGPADSDGPPPREYGWGGRGRYGCYYDEEDEDVDEDDEDGAEGLNIAEVNGSLLTIGYTVDLDGIPVNIHGIEIDEETEMVNGEMQDGNEYKREYEGYMGNVSTLVAASTSTHSPRLSTAGI